MSISLSFKTYPVQDGVHLFDPLAPHHEVLAREGIGATAAGAGGRVGREAG